MNKAVFLDRDGTLIVDKAYMHRLEDFELINGVVPALRKFKEMGYLLIIITNQSGIGRGYYTIEEANRFSDYVLQQLADSQCPIDAVYMCPHAPEEHCQCRKPSPYLIQKAISEWNISAAESYMFGDKDIDVECGNNAGVKAYKVTEEKNLLYWVNKIANHDI